MPKKSDAEFEILKEMDFGERIQGLYEATVIDADGGSITVNLASLHRIRLLYYQRALLQEALEFKYQPPKPSEHYTAGGYSLMHDYGKSTASYRTGKAR
jgi:hypothetical protein